MQLLSWWYYLLLCPLLIDFLPAGRGLVNASEFEVQTEKDRCDRESCRKRFKTIQCIVGAWNTSTASKECNGICVMRMSYGRRRKKRRGDSGYKEGHRHRTWHCQNHTTYPASAVNMCSDVDVPYPNLRIYREKWAIYVKYCCRTDDCNKDIDTIIMLPWFQFQNENVDQIYFDYFIIYTEVIVVSAVALWPFLIFLRDRKEEQMLYASLNHRLEEDVLNLAGKPQMKKTKVTKPVTGQLSFWELCRELTNMELRMRNPCLTTRDDAKPRYERYDHIAGGNGHKLVKVERTVMATYETYISTQILEHGPYVYDWKALDLVTTLSQAADIFESEATMLTLRLPITIIGDIRGRYQDLYRWFSIAGFPPRQKVLFLGNVRFPHDVFLIRGVCETLKIRFQPRFRQRNDSAIQSAATRLCNSLPLLARISNRILAVHSGLSHELTNYDCIDTVKRPLTLENMPPLAKHLIFSEPTARITMYRTGTATKTATFGFAAVQRVCKDMGVKLIVRGRNPIDDGICWLGKKQKLISLWSAPGKEAKKGAILNIRSDFLIHVYTLEKQSEKAEKAEK
ncbi:hypothetical protein Q1695_010127 [Nippostrongylus brasiliensis]|nr:hypothetical protein Q1695_010127 [Nippostrongylus brasiliensis]